jgi:hypothetical protein
MNTLMWRLHRNQVYIAGAAFIALTVLLLITGITMSNDYHTFLRNCGATHSCGDVNQLFSGDSLIIDLVNATMAVPLLFGVFWGAPLLAREFEDGTHNLAWTQGVTRRRWLSGNVIWALLAAAVWGGAMAALVSWWRLPENALGLPGVRISTGSFDVQGIVPVAYSVFAVALGIAVGSVMKRVLPAIATTLVAFVAVRLLVAQFARPHYMTPLSTLVPLGAGANAAPSGAWVLSTAFVGPNGRNYGVASTGTGGPAICRGSGSPLACFSSHGFHTLINGGVRGSLQRPPSFSPMVSSSRASRGVAR